MRKEVLCLLFVHGGLVQSASESTALLKTVGLTKVFGEVKACDGIDLAIAPGEIHALLGENGAGKSTLVKMMFGVLDPSEGEILWKGQPVRIGSPGEARRLGIGMVFQHFSLFEALTAAENIALVLEEKTQIAGGIRKVPALLLHFRLFPKNPEVLWVKFQEAIVGRNCLV